MMNTAYENVYNFNGLGGLESKTNGQAESSPIRAEGVYQNFMYGPTKYIQMVLFGNVYSFGDGCVEMESDFRMVTGAQHGEKAPTAPHRPPIPNSSRNGQLRNLQNAMIATHRRAADSRKGGCTSVLHGYGNGNYGD